MSSWDEDGYQCCRHACFANFDFNELKMMQNNFAELPVGQKNAFLTAFILASRNISPDENRRTQSYMLQGKIVCRTSFSDAFGVSRNVLTRILKQYSQINTSKFSGFDERRGGCPEKKKLSYEDSTNLVSFLDDIASTYGLPDPGRYMSRASGGYLLLIPHAMNPTNLYERYVQKMKDIHRPAVSVNTFKQIWKNTRPNIRNLTLRSDVCELCSKYQAIVSRNLLNSENPGAIDSVMNDFKIHRDKAKAARNFFRECQDRAKQAYQERIYRDGKELVKFLCVSFDYAEDTEIPSHTDQEGSMFFLAPLRLSLAAATDEGSEENKTFLLQETRKLRKCGSGVASLILEFLKRRNCTFDELVVFVDNTASQNKNVYTFSMFATIAIKKMFGCKSVRVSFLCVGHTKFSPDRWFVKRKLKHVNIDTVLDVEEAIFDVGKREDAKALGHSGHASVTTFSHCPKTGKLLFETYNFDSLYANECYPLSGQSLWYDIKLQNDGTIVVRGSPCGNEEESLGYFWESRNFIKDAEKVRKMDLSQLGRCSEETMTTERRQYLYGKIRPFVSVETKEYRLHPEYEKVCMRTFTCPSGDPNDAVTEKELFQFQGAEKFPRTITRSLVAKMKNLN